MLGSPQGGGARFQNGGAVPASKMAAMCPPSKWLPCPQAGQEKNMAAAPPLPKGPLGRVGRGGCFLPFCLRKALLKMAPWGGGMRPWCSSWVRAAIATVMGSLRMHPPKQTNKNQPNKTTRVGPFCSFCEPLNPHRALKHIRTVLLASRTCMQLFPLTDPPLSLQKQPLERIGTAAAPFPQSRLAKMSHDTSPHFQI